MSTHSTTETLQAHGRFVHDLAHALMRDPHAADDVAQETWVRWLRRGASAVRTPRNWLASAVRHQAANQRRADERRERHERLGAAHEDSLSPEDENERAELVHRVVDAVFALEEPYRETILARYLREIGARELARQRGEPLATVRSRERRALELLRARLDRGSGGRQAWAAGLARLVGPRASRVLPLLAAASAGILVVAFATLLWMRSLPAAAPPLEPRVASAAGSTEPGGGLLRQARESQREAAGTKEAEPRAMPSETGRLHGLATDEHGRPLSDVRVVIFNDGRSSPAAEALSDEKGRFHVDGLAHVTDVEAERPGYTLLHATDPELAGAGPWNEFRVVLARAGRVTVTALDARGLPLPGLEVALSPRPEELCEPDGSRSAALVRGAWVEGTTDESGLAVLEDVWTGVKLQCRLDLDLESSMNTPEYETGLQDGGTLVLEPGRPGAPIVVPSAGTLELRVAWAREFRLHGEVVWPDGRPAGPSDVHLADLGRGAETGLQWLRTVEIQDGGFDVVLREPYLLGPLEVRAWLEGGGKAQAILKDDGVEGLTAHPPEVAARMELEAREAIEQRELRLELLPIPTNLITLRALDPNGTPVTGEHGFLVLPSEPRTALHPTVVQLAQGPTVIWNLPSAPTDVLVWLPRTATRSSVRFHAYRDIPAGGRDIELRLPAISAVRVRLRPSLEVDRCWTLVEASFPPAGALSGGRASTTTLSRPWPDGLPVSGTSKRREKSADGVAMAWVEPGTLQGGSVLLEPGDPGWYRFGLAARSADGRAFAARATDLAWFGAGEHELACELVPTTSVEGRLVADGALEFLGLALVDEDGAPVPIGTLDEGKPLSTVIPVATHGRFQLNIIPIGRFRLRAGSVDELAAGRYRREVELELVEGANRPVELRL
jgi:RNA polymerase sigma-70 factor (ECF subfamily)